MRQNKRKSNRGIGFLELMLVLAIFALLVGLGTPSFQGLLHESRSRAALTQLRSLFATARQEAVFSGRQVTVCAVDADGQCHRSWSSGHTISVFVDENRNGRRDSHELVKRENRWPLTRSELSWRASLARSHLTFEANGGTWQNGTLYYCPANGDARYARAIVISQTGRSYLTGDRNRDGIREDRMGKNIEC